MRPDAECGKQMNEPQGQRPSSRWGSALSWGVSPRKNTEETSVFLCVGCVCEEMTEYTHSHSCSCIFWIRSTADFLVGFAETGRNKLRHRVRRMPFKRDSRTLWADPPLPVQELQKRTFSFSEFQFLIYAAQPPKKSPDVNLADKGIFLCQTEITPTLISAQSGLHIKRISGGVLPPAGAAEDYNRGPIPLRKSHQLPVNYSKIESR